MLISIYSHILISIFTYLWLDLYSVCYNLHLHLQYDDYRSASPWPKVSSNSVVKKKWPSIWKTIQRSRVTILVAPTGSGSFACLDHFFVANFNRLLSSFVHLVQENLMTNPRKVDRFTTAFVGWNTAIRCCCQDPVCPTTANWCDNLGFLCVTANQDWARWGRHGDSDWQNT